MEDIARLEALYAFAEAKGLLSRIRSLRAGALALEVEPPASPPLPPAVYALPEQPPDHVDAERHELEALFWSSGADVGPFLPTRKA